MGVAYMGTQSDLLSYREAWPEHWHGWLLMAASSALAEANGFPANL
jgi:hypothetical protein